MYFEMAFFYCGIKTDK